MVKKLKFVEQKEEKLLRLDLGTGKGLKKPDGFIGVDIIKDTGVDRVVDLLVSWPWKANSVDEVHADYLIQYFDARQRVHFMNELCRVLKKDAKAVIIAPHWCSHKAYADGRVKWPPVAESWFMTLNKNVRMMQNFTDTSGLLCDFDVVVGYGMHPAVAARPQEYQQHAVAFFKEAVQDLHATLTKR